MERFSQKRTQAAAKNNQQAANNETFSEMASATASRQGLVGKLLVISLIVVSLVVTIFAGIAIFSSLSGSESVKEDQYQAVFLTDGQIYFGKLSALDKEYAELTDIYYLQVEQQVQPVQGEQAQQQQPRISLARLGNELHGPEDQMFINRDRILFWENLKTDGSVSEAIAEFKANGGNLPANNQPAAPATDGASGTQPAGTPAVDDTPGDTTELPN